MSEHQPRENSEEAGAPPQGRSYEEASRLAHELRSRVHALGPYDPFLISRAIQSAEEVFATSGYEAALSLLTPALVDGESDSPDLWSLAAWIGGALGDKRLILMAAEAVFQKRCTPVDPLVLEMLRPWTEEPEYTDYARERDVVDTLLVAARAGKTDAMLDLALRYRSGVGVMQSEPASAWWAEKARAAGDKRGAVVASLGYPTFGAFLDALEAVNAGLGALGEEADHIPDTLERALDDCWKKLPRDDWHLGLLLDPHPVFIEDLEICAMLGSRTATLLTGRLQLSAPRGITTPAPQTIERLRRIAGESLPDEAGLLLWWFNDPIYAAMKLLARACEIGGLGLGQPNREEAERWRSAAADRKRRKHMFCIPYEKWVELERERALERPATPPLSVSKPEGPAPATGLPDRSRRDRKN